MELYKILEERLKAEPNYVTDSGELKKWVIIYKAQHFDEELISVLLDDKDLKAKFFISIKKVLVFNQSLFVQFLEQKNFLNDSYTAYKNKIGINIGGKFLSQRNEVSLVWPFKDCVLEGGQSREEDKREEIFFNELLAQDEITQLLEPKVLTNAIRYTAAGAEAVNKFTRDQNGRIKDNLIIKGNNLLALHSLKQQFAGQIKLIYIDPPFNTGNDSFQYNDSFNHSTWLTFMRNRLVAAKEFLSEEGIIFINIDDIEEAYLRVLCDEIFGANNFLNVIAVKSSTPSGTKTAHKDKTIIKQKDLILVYRKGAKVKLNPQYAKRNSWDPHYSLMLKRNNEGEYILIKLADELKELNILASNQKLENINVDDTAFKNFYLENASSICRLTSHKNIEADKISRSRGAIVYEHFAGKISKGLYYNGQVISPLSQVIKKVYNNQKITDDLGILLCDFWADIDFQNTQNEGGVSFPTAKKPEALLSRIIEMTTEKHDIVMDFHLGSGTTCAVAHKTGRQYIGIEQIDYGEDDSVKRMENVITGEQSGVSKAYKWKGGGEFIYLELKKYNETFIDLIAKAKDSASLLKIWEEMKSKSFLNYNVDIKKQEAHLAEFIDLSLSEQKQHLASLLDKNQLFVNFSSLNDKDFSCTDGEKRITKDFYQIKN